MRPSRYSPKEVQVLIEAYADMREARSTANAYGLHTIVRHADLGRALENLTPKEYHAVLLHGLLGLDTRYAGTLLGVHHSTVEDRYHAGISLITDYLNGAV